MLNIKEDSRNTSQFLGLLKQKAQRHKKDKEVPAYIWAGCLCVGETATNR